MKAKMIILIALLGILSYVWYQVIHNPHKTFNPFNKQSAVNDQYNPYALKRPKPTRLNSFRAKLFYANPYTLKWNTLPKDQTDYNWQIKKNNQLAKLASGHAYDVLVLPVEMELPLLDRVTRMLVSQIIADEIRTRTHERVMPVELAQRLLGKYSFRFSDKDIERLAKQFNIRKVIRIYCNGLPGTPEKVRHIKLGFYVSENGRKPSTNIMKLSPVMAGGNKTVEMEVWNKASKIVNKWYPHARAYVKKTYTSLPEFNLGGSLQALLKEKDDPYLQALNFQLLGMLTPSIDTYDRNRYMARSLISLRHVDPKTKNYRVLYARAMFYLYRRPVAVDVLKNTSSPNGKALLDFLNGNLPELRAQYKDIHSNVFKLFSYLELYDLAYTYNVLNVKQYPKFKAAGDTWKRFINYRQHDQDDWYAPNTTKLFLSFGGIFPEFNKELIKIIKQKYIVGDIDPEDYKSELLFMHAYNHLVNSIPNQTDAGLYTQNMSEYDLLDLFQNIGIYNFDKELQEKIYLQGSYTDAGNLIDVLNNSLSGNIMLTKNKLELALQLAKKADGDERSHYIKEIIDLSRRILDLDVGTDLYTLTAKDAFNKYNYEYTKIFGVPPKYAVRYDPSHLDQPSGFYYYEYNSLALGLYYTNTNISCLDSALRNFGGSSSLLPSATKPWLQQELDDRFDGNPTKTRLIVAILEYKGQTKKAMHVMQKAVDNKSNNWHLYNDLAKKLIEAGKIQQASNDLQKYPGFTNTPTGKSVEMSDNSYDAGTLFYHIGDTKDAKWFYKISAKLNTGSYASLASAERIAIINKNYLRALRIAQFTAHRYNSPYSYRDFLVFLNLYGYTDQANTGFNELAQKFDKPQIWTSQFVGQRIRKLDMKAISQWALDYKKTANQKQTHHDERFLFLQAVTDRKLSNKSLAQITNAMRTIHKQASTARIIKPDTMYQFFKDPRDPLARNQEHTPAQNPDKFATALAAYHFLAHKHYAKALDKFIAYTRYHKITGDDKVLGSILLPYIAYTATMSGKTPELERYLKQEKIFGKSMTFDKYLTNSVYLAAKQDIQGSLTAMDKAFNVVPFSGKRAIYGWYEAVQLCEWLSESTSDKRYLTKALNMVRKFEVIQPQFAWAYAFDAKYSKDTKERVRAAAFASYLDPHSRWLSSVPASIQKRGHAWWKRHNPFVLPTQQGPMNRIGT